MGGEATVVVAGPRRLLGVASRRIEDLEAKWSRFRPVSEISVLHRRRHRPSRVSADTRLLLRHGITAWHATDGAFDPSVHDAVVAWGYDRDLALVGGAGPAPEATPAPGLGDLELDDGAGTACLNGCGFDPGGIGKGLAADLVATELVAAGADAALVALSGDVRIAGTPGAAGWTVSVEDPIEPATDLLRMALRGGGLATSSDRRRRWTVGDGEAHHLIDPATGAPADPTLAGVTVLAGEAWWAEALTKAVLVGGFHVAALGELSASGIGRTKDGAVVGTHDLLELREQAA
jgi:thiamine biosynthesis lipoprotein